jgi:outer membrane protein
MKLCRWQKNAVKLNLRERCAFCLKKRGAVILLLLLYCFDANAQKDTVKTVSLTLNQVWEQASIYNKTLQMQELRVQTSQENIKDAKADRLPDLTAEAEYARVSNLPLYENGLFSTPSRFPVLHTFYRVGGDASFNLYNGNKVNLKIAEEQTAHQIAAAQKNLSTEQIRLRAAAFYLDMQRSLIFKNLVLQDIKDQEKQLEQIRQLQKNGVVLKSDVLRAQLQLSRQRLSLVQIDNDMAIANQRLNLMIGQPENTTITPVTITPPDSLSIKSYDEYLADAMNHSFQYQISERETELRRLQLRDVRANVSPRVALFANYAFAYPQIQFYPYAGTLYGLGMAGIRASFPFTSFYHNYHKTKAAELEYKRQEIEHSDTQDAIKQQVKEAYLRYKEALNRIDVARTNITQAAENLRILNNTYFNQLSLVTDLLDANTQLLQTRFDLAAAQIAAQLQYYQLQQAIGNL